MKQFTDKLIPLMCRLVGVAFFVGGILSLVIALLFYSANRNQPVVGLVILVAAGFINFVVGYCVIKYMPKLMLSRFNKLKDKGFF